MYMCSISFLKHTINKYLFQDCHTAVLFVISFALQPPSEQPLQLL